MSPLETAYWVLFALNLYAIEGIAFHWLWRQSRRLKRWLEERLRLPD